VGSSLGLASSEVLLGQMIYIRGAPFQVIGVLEEKGDGFGSTDENIYVPLATAQHRLMGADRLQTISIQAASAADLDELMVEVDRVLRGAHRIGPGEPSDFTVQNQASLVAIVEDTARLFSFLLAGIAGISLVVGGIGIMNIMLVSVTERTREIGLRKALGAKPRDLLTQFLIESIVLCLAGGAFGILLGFGGSEAITRLGGLDTGVSVESVLLAFGFSAGVGLFFGIWPARRAAKLPPIEALRFE
jgi:putative ABC transport system permease protein